MKNGVSGTPTASTYSYPAAGAARPHAVTQVSATTGSSTVTDGYQYDASGAMTTRAGQAVTYDESGRVSSVVDGTKTEKSIYTADGQLLLRWGGSDGASLFLGDTVLRMVGTTTTGVRSYQVAGISVAERTSGAGGGLWWLSPDPVGTVGLQINAATGVVTRRWMDPYGVARGGVAVWSSNFGYLNQPVSATGLTQLGARAYDAGLGKFISVDPILDTGDARQINAYAYAINSPVSFADASGLFFRAESLSGASAPMSHKKTTSTTTTKQAGPGGGPKAVSDAPPAAGNTRKAEAAWSITNWDSNSPMFTEANPYGDGGAAAEAIGITALVAAGVVCVIVSAGACIVAGVVIGAGTSLAQYTVTTAPEARTFEDGAYATTLGAAFGGAGVGVGLATNRLLVGAAAKHADAGAAANSRSALVQASDAAFKAADDQASIFVKNKHLASATGNGAKFASDDIGQVQGWISRGLKSDAAVFLPNELDDTFRVVVPGGGVIGTKGQEFIRVIVTGDGRVINAFPVNVR
ncbi:RHS repeat-associated core domain-containing protein [Microbacterium bovistercoris]|uniref:RHS repeat-associated core domain-containing protein n=1 Tax=Microbacterium bovistercoris TaxID=2293570 RepID=UPI0015F253B9|nr:RHS repeat-associated core domain-containing protein [Microbacterium bovistercoris]